MHCHIIPGVDDGSSNMEESLSMIKLAYDNETRKIIATPHYGTARARARKGEIIQQFLEFKEEVRVRYPDMELYLGQELSFGESLPQKLMSGAALSMADSRYALVEFMPQDDYDYIRQGLLKVQMAGYRPILAHVERCPGLMKNISYVEDLVNMGVYIQMNAMSITGENGWKCKSYAKKLLKEELVDLVASDAHDTKKRKPTIKKAAEYISKKYGTRYAANLCINNPNKIINNEEI